MINLKMSVEKYINRDYISNLLEKNRRIDGRKFDEYRKINVRVNFVSEKAEGSAYVKLGDTEVLAGVKLDTGVPFQDRPNEGVITVNAELRPIASNLFESGPPNENTIELARVVDRGIRESNTIDLKKMIVEDTSSSLEISQTELEEGGKVLLARKVWIIAVDIYVLNDGGNLIDAAGIAAMMALLNTRIPKYENGVIIRKDYVGKLPVSKIAVPVTFAKIGDKIILDPNYEEDMVKDARLTITTTDTINAIQKGGNGTFTIDEIKKCVDIAFEKGNEIREILKNSITSE